MGESNPIVLASAPLGSDWVVTPDLSPGVRVQITSVVEASELSPEVLQLLVRAMSEMQKSDAGAGQTTARVTCPKLKSCDNYVGGCPRLANCGNYALH